jgi:uncharacterized protein (TIGR02001 family)
MIKKTLIAGLVAAACGSGLAQAQQAPASPHSITGNVGLFSQYIFRGLTQTNKKPALQGGFDYSHASGLYAGTWASNISWLSDSSSTGYTSSSLEWDFYGGYKGTIAKSDLGYDVGLLYYYYPGDFSAAGAAAGIGKSDTTEIYGALSWKWLSGKLSYSVGNKTFGVTNSDGTWYLDLTASYPITDKLTVQAHYGIQEFSGTSAACPSGSNDSCASYEDYKLGFTYALPRDFTFGVFLSGTDMNAAQKSFYTNALNRELGKDTVTLFLQKTF